MRHAQQSMALVEPELQWDRKTGRRKRAAEIVDAAARVFAERGYHGTTTQDIADELGLRQASLYYYFRSKEAALERVCEHGVAGFVEAAEAILATDLSFRDKLVGLIEAHLAPTEARRDYVRVFINERRYLPKAARRRVGRAARRVEQVFQTVIEAGIRDGSFRTDSDPRLATLAVLGMCNAVINWRPSETAGRTGAIANQFAGLVLAGLASSPGMIAGPSPRARPAPSRRAARSIRRRRRD